MNTSGLEHRAGFDVRATSDRRRLTGYAAVFGVPAKIGSFTESIRAGAFTRTLAAGGDTLALLNHNDAHVLARVSNGSLRLHQDSRGLAFDLDLPSTSWGADALALVEAGLAGGMSFAFRPHSPGGEAWPAANTRELRSLDLAEISLVSSHPAYSGTEVHARARSSVQVPCLTLRRRRMLAAV